MCGPVSLVGAVSDFTLSIKSHPHHRQSYQCIFSLLIKLLTSLIGAVGAHLIERVKSLTAPTRLTKSAVDPAGSGAGSGGGCPHRAVDAVKITKKCRNFSRWMAATMIVVAQRKELRGATLSARSVAIAVAAPALVSINALKLNRYRAAWERSVNPLYAHD
jgi:hypothetical protein